jgi:hypothetical protein
MWRTKDIKRERRDTGRERGRRERERKRSNWKWEEKRAGISDPNEW